MEQVRENKMGTMSINRLLLSISLPIMISMLVQALYNIVDTAFVSAISDNAFTALSLAFPAQQLMISIATGTGVGMNALLSKSLGEKRFTRANRTAMNGIFLSFAASVVFILLGLAFSRLFFAVQTDDPEIIQLGTTYLTICTLGSFGIFGGIIFERLLQSTGKSVFSMISQGTGAIVNIILDPIFIFGYFGLPAMGVAGAAIATVIGQLCGTTLSIFLNVRHNRELTFSFQNFKPEGGLIRRIYAIGLPSIIMTSIGSLMVFWMNAILLGFSTIATNVLGAYFRLQSFIFMPVFGLNNGMVPILAYNYGARKRERIVKTIRLSITYGIAIMLLGLIIFQLFPRQLLLFFNASDYMLEIGIPALRSISLSFLFAGFCIVCASVFQAMGRATFSLLVSVIRQIGILLPAAYLLSLLGNVDYVWYAYPIAEIGSVTFSAICLRQLYVKVIRPIPPQQPILEIQSEEGSSPAGIEDANPDTAHPAS